MFCVVLIIKRKKAIIKAMTAMIATKTWKMMLKVLRLSIAMLFYKTTIVLSDSKLRISFTIEFS